MAEAVFRRIFDAVDVKRGVSVRVHPNDEPQTQPAWVIAQAIEAGAATDDNPATDKKGK